MLLRIASVLLMLTSCLLAQSSPPAMADKPPLRPMDGSVEGNTYSNFYFKFAVDFPAGWTVHGEETNKRLMEVGKEKVTSSGAVSEGVADISASHTYNLLTVFEHPLGTPGVTANRAFLAAAENVVYAPGIKSGDDYLKNTIPVMQKSGATVVSGPEDGVISGQKFSKVVFSMNTPVGSVLESMYVTMKEGFAVAFVMIAADEAGLADAVKAMQSFRPLSRRVQLTSEAVSKQQTKMVNPGWSALARAAKIQGSVLLKVLIGTDGKVKDVQVVRGHPALVRDVVPAVKQWEYKPFVVDGEPVEVEVDLTVNFVGM